MDLRDQLSADDIKRLLVNPDVDAKAGLAETIGAQIDAKTLSPQELGVAQTLIRVLVKDASERVRRSLSESLKKSDDVPHDVAMSLAKDIESVALPMLEASPVFSNEELIEIISLGSANKQVAIARRERVEEVVSEALVQTENEQVTHTLVSNTGAKISQSSYDNILVLYPNNEEVQQRLAVREDVPLEITEKLITMVSGQLKDFLLEKKKLSVSQANVITQDARERATVDLVEEARNVADVVSFVKHLHKNHRLTPSLIARGLCTGDINFFEAAMAQLAGLPRENASLMIHDAGKLGLKAVVDRTPIPKVYYPLFRVAIDVMRETDYDGYADDQVRYRSKMVERILTQYERIDPEDVDYLISVLEDRTVQSKAA